MYLVSVSLSNIRIVLVNTSHPGNIGACARAMKTMNLSGLNLVQPKVFPSAEATARASGADDVLAGAQVFETLDAALAGCVLVIGASARQRTIAWPELTPRECARQVIAQCARAPVALVFGREHSGLTNSELERCNALVRIPSNPDFSSLNIAAAVQILAYEIMLTSLEPTPHAISDTEEEPATAAELELLYAHMQQALTDIGFLDPANPRQLMRRLRRLFNRPQLDKIEVNILRGILAAAQTQNKLRHEE
ncbi:MAG: tRNA (cytosine(32)/uridine(32)-2'-O)-methyltransferase TrmJ [Gammaproteobacteria bacterium]|nr:tRNA (cytosine(32)/uridine(32)-2'-O)-methyltransferase TrmJ [Gammaproteobacteria bacterium]